MIGTAYEAPNGTRLCLYTHAYIYINTLGTQYPSTRVHSKSKLCQSFM